MADVSSQEQELKKLREEKRTAMFAPRQPPKKSAPGLALVSVGIGIAVTVFLVRAAWHLAGALFQ